MKNTCWLQIELGELETELKEVSSQEKLGKQKFQDEDNKLSDQSQLRLKEQVEKLFMNLVPQLKQTWRLKKRNQKSAFSA